MKKLTRNFSLDSLHNCILYSKGKHIYLFKKIDGNNFIFESITNKYLYHYTRSSLYFLYDEYWYILEKDTPISKEELVIEKIKYLNKRYQDRKLNVQSR